MNLPVRHGKDPVIQDVQNLTFNDQIFSDGTLVKDATFNQMSNAAWTSPNKNNGTLTTPTKN